jgi:uncharacterized RDD family membrane protein YckC
VDREQLRIAGLTGVEITLDLAGAGSRSFAFIIDWHIRFFAALMWLLTALYLTASVTGQMPTAAQMPKAFTSVGALPAFAIYFLYHPLLEILMRGRTPGKRMAGVRIVTRHGGAPSIGALLVRNLFRLIDSLPFLYLVGLIVCLTSEQRVRVGDMAAGTLLVLDESASEKSLGRFSAQLAGSALPPSVIELVNELLQRWPWLDSIQRGKIARIVLARTDASLTAQTLATLGDVELHRRLRTINGT